MHIAATGTPVVGVGLLRLMRSESIRLLIVPSLIGWITGLFIFRRPSPLVLAAVAPTVGVF